MRNLVKLIPYLVVSGMVVLLDQITKLCIVKNLSYGEILPIFHFFNLVHYYNTGSAFGFLADQNGWQFYFLSGVSFLAIGFIVYLLIQEMKTRQRFHFLFCFALSFILGGAIGNLYDRLNLGYVIDFLDFHIDEIHWPAFNIADSAISIGIVLLMASELFKLRRTITRKD